MNGRDKLREQLDAMAHALRAFDDPLVDEYPGLRLMKDVLGRRRQHIAGELDAAERCQLTLTVEAAGEAVPVDVVVPLLAAVQETVRSFAEARAEGLPGVDADQARTAVALRVARWDGPAVTLTGPDVPLPARVADPRSGITLMEVALGDLLDALQEGDMPALRALADLLAANPLTLTVSFSPVVGDDREVRLERRDAARLASGD
ncbi:MAG TPA: hypothetical protein VM324_06920 [Egibacteraceae bacterium]|nr:hypothetical protein [Egibacteraceae bacterium]